MKAFLLALFIANCILAVAQVPQNLNYQAVARNANGTVIPSTLISVEISIRDGSPNPPNVYQEIDTATTNQFGLFTVAIGTGQIQSGNFVNINWATGNKYLNVGFDRTGGNSFTDMGTTELLSVPYALYAAKSANGSAWLDYAVYSETEPNGASSQTTIKDSTWQPRLLNVTEDSAGTAISRNSNEITLQPGQYHVSAFAQWGLTVSYENLPNVSFIFSNSLLRLADVSNNTYLTSQGEHETITAGGLIPEGFPNTTDFNQQSYSTKIEGVINITTATTLILQHYVGYQSVGGNNHNSEINPVGGIPMGIGQNEVYSRMLIQKIN